MVQSKGSVDRYAHVTDWCWDPNQVLPLPFHPALDYCETWLFFLHTWHMCHNEDGRRRISDTNREQWTMELEGRRFAHKLSSATRTTSLAENKPKDIRLYNGYTWFLRSAGRAGLVLGVLGMRGRDKGERLQKSASIKTLGCRPDTGWPTSFHNCTGNRHWDLNNHICCMTVGIRS